MLNFRVLNCGTLAIAMVCGLAGVSSAAPRDGSDFVKDVYPLFQRACVECHGEKKQAGGLRLDTREAALRGGDTGKAWVAGKPEASELVRRISLPRDDDEAMPARGALLSKAQIETIRRWIAGGAEWPTDAKVAKHWAYIAPRQPPLPQVANPAWPKTSVDHFILARLESEGLTPSPEADRRVLLRRLSLDLIGLPPTPAEIAAFEGDSSPAAYERLVERLLQSPQFGVRWARPWLDAARYADSHGFQRDDFRNLWPYRDWVVNALNADMPFDQFTVEQLAGDLLPNATDAQRIATGFNRSAPTNVEAGSDPEETRVNQVFDRVNTLGMVWLGATLECCQCHDHKYDPFTLRDYYGLFAFFNNTAIEAERANPKVPGSIRFVGREMAVSDPVLEPRRAEAANRLNEARERLAARAKQLAETGVAWEAEHTRLAKEVARLEAEFKTLELPTTLVMQELDAPRSSTMFERGDFRTPGKPVSPQTPECLPGLPQSEETPNRLALARWLVRRENPLVARVTVNRWWSELFGYGLVTTPEDFGIKGEPPTHPELLDWLAVEFMDSSWSMKHVLRTLVLSATYRQSSRVSPQLLALDDQNLLYARGPRVRLDAEGIRDNALAIAGLLSPRLGGTSIRPYQPDGVWIKVGGERYDYVVSPGDEKYRRGLYVVWKRGAPYPSFVNFDAGARLACRVKRSRSNTPLQALTLMNDPVYVEAALAFARRVLVERQEQDDGERLAYAFELATARRPTPGELKVLSPLLAAQREAAKADIAGARKLVGEIALPKGISTDELAAWYAVCAALLNLDETITKG